MSSVATLLSNRVPFTYWSDIRHFEKKNYSRFFTGANVWSATVLLTKCRMKVPEANLMSDRRRGGGKSRMAMEGSDRWDIKLFLCCWIDEGMWYIFQMSDPTERCPQKTAGHIRSKDTVWFLHMRSEILTKNISVIGAVTALRTPTTTAAPSICSPRRTPGIISPSRRPGQTGWSTLPSMSRSQVRDALFLSRLHHVSDLTDLTKSLMADVFSYSLKDLQFILFFARKEICWNCSS